MSVEVSDCMIEAKSILQILKNHLNSSKVSCRLLVYSGKQSTPTTVLAAPANVVNGNNHENNIIGNAVRNDDIDKDSSDDKNGDDVHNDNNDHDNNSICFLVHSHIS